MFGHRAFFKSPTNRLTIKPSDFWFVSESNRSSARHEQGFMIIVGCYTSDNFESSVFFDINLNFDSD